VDAGRTNIPALADGSPWFSLWLLQHNRSLKWIPPLSGCRPPRSCQLNTISSTLMCPHGDADEASTIRIWPARPTNDDTSHLGDGIIGCVRNGGEEVVDGNEGRGEARGKNKHKKTLPPAARSKTASSLGWFVPDAVFDFSVAVPPPRHLVIFENDRQRNGRTD